ncbi:Outer membrane efflux protein BepC precursor [Limihaloglobus sulfuriphilus]|uniref:Outer membrane efflux protein BepC n=1 Tax=Limihaloglobus sulfuriphilus TaxID=1851148 RepID=A0A1Q2MHT1_9BACT|nr:TolC family protein [Limihaloglobus sulfuriphilus]AQQ72209.1 Outer membrane efflux protein BepC precursor [Limihaloglobus sulfuriphilus]
MNVKRNTSVIFIVSAVFALAAGCTERHYERSPSINQYMPPSVPVSLEGAAEKPEQANTAAADKDLTLDACIRIAQAQNPLLQASREGLAAANYAVQGAKSGYYPHVNLAADYRRFQSHAFLPGGLGGAAGPQTSVIGPTNDYSGGLSAQWLLFDSGRRRAQLASAKANANASKYELETVEQDITLMVQQAYYSLLSAYEALKIARENQTRAQDHLSLAQQRKDVGVAVEADVLRMRVEVAERRLSVVRAENLVRIGKGNLNTAMGLPPELELEIVDALPRIIPPETVDLNESFKSAMMQRSELKAALHRITGSQSDVAAAKSDFGPVLRAIGSYGLRDSEFWPHDKDWSAGIGVELPLFTGFERSSQLNRLRRELAREEALIRRLIITIRQEIWTSYSHFTEAFEEMKASQTLVKDARESMRLARERYQVGKSTATDLLDSQTALSRAESVLVEAQWNYHIAKAAFERSKGFAYNSDSAAAGD